MRYKTKVVVGSQWGDEGKGKIVDFLAANSQVVIRFQGGNNAGHTIYVNNKKYALQHLPSGILNKATINIMAQGMVINPPMLITELNNLFNDQWPKNNLFISDKAHIILPYHIAIDKQIEKIKDNNPSSTKIGTTNRGIGPCYEDKINRLGIRMADFIDEKQFKQKLQNTLLIKNKILQGLGCETYDVDKLWNEYKTYAAKLKPYVIQTERLIMQEIKAQKKVIFEGAQGTMLCIENGSYPFVTSSSPTATYVGLGSGISNNLINEVIGVVKAYTTRVGGGHLPSKIQDDTISDIIQTRGHEFGTVTKRKRGIGWLDTVVLNHAKQINGFTSLAITLVDVLDTLKEIKIVHKYILNDQEIDYIPSAETDFANAKTKTITMPGWEEDISGVKSYDQLPSAAKNYLKKIEDLTQLPIGIVSVGPKQEQTFIIRKEQHA